MLTRSTSRVLIVGAGAVGQVYGFHLSQMGCDVSVLVKPKYEQAARKGYLLHRHTLRGSTVHSFKPDRVFTDAASARGIWHQIWLCVPTPAIYEPWFDDFARQMVGDSTLVVFQPGLDEYDYICTRFNKERVVQGMIGMISYQAPLPGEHLQPGVAYYFPPFTPSSFSGPPDRATAVVEALQRGGCPAALSQDAGREASIGTSLLTPMIAGLEVANWSFDRFSSSPMLPLALDAAAETAAIVEAKTGAKSRILAKIQKPWIFKFALPVARGILPFPLETYLRTHFTKVRSQTIGNMNQYLKYGAQFRLPIVSIRRLNDLWSKSLENMPATTMAQLASMSANVAAVNTPMLKAPIVDEPTQRTILAAPIVGQDDPLLDVPTNPRVAIPDASTAPAVLVTNPKPIAISDEVERLKRDTPLPGHDP